MTNLVEIIVGTYEEFLLGYKVESAKDDNKQTLAQSFATRSHAGSIRSIAVRKYYLASGGSDEKVYMYDMRSRKEIQILTHHEGTINTVTFTPDASHLLTGSDDGKMCAVRIGSWQVEGIWKKAHSGSQVTHISCHPSGKLALSLGSDLTLRTWNLIKGRMAYTTNLKTKTELGRNPDCLSWSPDGDHFTITGLRIVEIWSVKTAGIVREFKTESKPVCICWLSEEKLAVGFEDGILWILNVKSDEEPCVHKLHEQRVKAIAYVNKIMATASSNGEVCLWSVKLKKNSIGKITSTNIGCRPTCIALLDLTQFGDDYVLKLENSEDESEVEEEAKPARRSAIKPIGNVIVEIEEDDDDISQSDDEVERKRKTSDKRISTDGVSKKKKNKNKQKNVSKGNTSKSEDSFESEVPHKKKKLRESKSQSDDSPKSKKQKKKRDKSL